MNNTYDRELIPVEGKIGVFRNSENSSIVNTNNSAYEEYVRRRNIISKKDENIKNVTTEIENVKSEVDGIKDELCEIKSLLKELIQQSK
jgi:hypothetical protein